MSPDTYPRTNPPDIRTSGGTCLEATVIGANVRGSLSGGRYPGANIRGSSECPDTWPQFISATSIWNTLRANFILTSFRVGLIFSFLPYLTFYANYFYFYSIPENPLKCSCNACQARKIVTEYYSKRSTIMIQCYTARTVHAFMNLIKQCAPNGSILTKHWPVYWQRRIQLVTLGIRHASSILCSILASSPLFLLVHPLFTSRSLPTFASSLSIYYTFTLSFCLYSLFPPVTLEILPRRM